MLVHATHFPARDGTSSQTALQQKVDEIFEVKSMYANNTQYSSHVMHFGATNQRLRFIKEMEYPGKFRKFDIKFAGDQANAETGPFSKAQLPFIFRELIPLVFGAFGDVNGGVETLVKELVRNAVNSDSRLSVSLLVNMDRKGGYLRLCCSSSSRRCMFHW